MKLTKKHPLFSRFLNLTCRLSPENLCCDGEISRADTRRRWLEIMKEWRQLEEKFGAKVTEDMVWDAELNRG